MEVWFEFNWLRVEAGGQRLRLMKSHCRKTGGGGILSVFLIGGRGGGGCDSRCVYVATLVFDFVSTNVLVV